MKRFTALKALAIVAATGFAFAAPASADHRDNHKGEVVIGIIGGIIEGAIVEKEREEDHARRCSRWFERCEEGCEWACERYERRCD
jgi:hypothetical protein